MEKSEVNEAPAEVEHIHSHSKEEHTNYELVDKELAQYAGEERVEIDDATNKRLKRLIDKRILLVMILTYLTQALDKGTMSFASVMGIKTDANLVGAEYSWLTTVIYLVILVVEYPENYIIQRVPIAKWLSLNIILWGITLALHSIAKNFTALVILRGFLGGFEAACQPTFVLLSSMWYKREEQAGTIIYWYMMNGLQQIIGGLIAFGFSFVPAGSHINSWQGLFLTYGVITVFWGIFVFFWMPDSPMRAKCFSEEDKKLMVERVRENRTGLQNRIFRREQVWDAFSDPQLWGFALIQILTTLPSGGIGAYANLIIAGFGFTTWQTQLLQMVVGAILIIVMLSAVYIDKYFHQTIYAMMAALIPTIIGVVVLISVPLSAGNKTGLLIAYYIMYSFWACSGLALALVTRNVAGQTKKSVIIATNFVCWAVGNSIGPQIFRSQDAPRYFLALAIVLGCFCLLEIVLFALRLHYHLANKRRDQKIASGEVAADTGFIHAFEDITDRVSPSLRCLFGIHPLIRFTHRLTLISDTHIKLMEGSA
ncbi:major facilitator superfamily transporter [Xylariales sp. PMI_506]|nr:major facilitator superfamily transporter [Xylariales sp. PMI_506]